MYEKKTNRLSLGYIELCVSVQMLLYTKLANPFLDYVIHQNQPHAGITSFSHLCWIARRGAARCILRFLAKLLLDCYCCWRQVCIQIFHYKNTPYVCFYLFYVLQQTNNKKIKIRDFFR